MKDFISLFFIFQFILTLGCAQKMDGYRVAFYNVENLFDLHDDPIKLDEDFTPHGKQNWTKERYHTKMIRLSQVLDSMGRPTFIGLAEVENLAVVKDLAKTGGLKKCKYAFVHQESPDRRGIDVAFMYDKKQFKLISSDFIRIDFPVEDDEEYTSRDILHAVGKTSKGDTLHFFVNHWPSRRGGVEKSEPKRVLVAKHLRSSIDQILLTNPDANIIIMGDFNDEPDNRSIVSILGALPLDSDPQRGYLYNCFSDYAKQKQGSYRYRADWNALDQIIVSGSLLNGQAHLKATNPVIFSRDWMLYKNNKYGFSPNRTYGGPRYYGGYSDHLPVSLDLMKN
ncbi:MAG: endonuclease [Saprospiraceae bacterium]|nr:MAG: endonuclease [Saprospiraceae bacterium]